MDEELVVVNFKIPKAMRNDFKRAARKNGATMQAILYSLAVDYIENADHLKIRIVDVREDGHE